MSSPCCYLHLSTYGAQDVSVFCAHVLGVMWGPLGSILVELDFFKSFIFTKSYISAGFFQVLFY